MAAVEMGGSSQSCFPRAHVPAEKIRGWKGNGGRRRRGLDCAIS